MNTETNNILEKLSEQKLDKLKGLYVNVQSHEFLKNYEDKYVVDFCRKLYELEDDVYNWWYNSHDYNYKGNGYFQVFRSLTHDINMMMNNLKICYQSDDSETLDKYKVNDNVINVFCAFLNIIKCIIYNEEYVPTLGFTYNQYKDALKRFTSIKNEDGETYRCVNCIKENVRYKLADYMQGEIDKHKAGSRWYYTETAEWFKKEIELLRSGAKVTQNYLFEE